MFEAYACAAAGDMLVTSWNKHRQITVIAISSIHLRAIRTKNVELKLLQQALLNKQNTQCCV